MGRLIVTNTTISKVPYCMKESGHRLYSYEELCYYICSRMPLWLEERNRDGLTEKLKEWGLQTVDVDGLSPYEAAKKIFQAGNYLRKDEKEPILEQMEKYGQKKELFREKEKGDLYLAYKKNRKAYLAYVRGIALLTGEEEPELKASLYHNMAVVCCRFFYWKEAKKWFALSLDAKDSQESRIGLELVLDLEKKQWRSDGKPVDQEKLRQRQQDFLQECR